MKTEAVKIGGTYQGDHSQNDPKMPNYVRNRTHYKGLMYSDYIDYFDVHPNKVGVGVYPLVLANAGNKSFAFDTFLDPENLKASYSASTGNRMATELVLRVYLKFTGGESDLKVSTWSETFIDKKNYKFDANPALGLTIYAIRDITALTEEYKNMFSENGLYLEVSKDQATIASGYCLNVSFKVYEYNAIDEKYIPSIVPRTSTAAVGQTIAVKAVDGLGKPTEWETVDMGGGDVFIAHFKESGDGAGEFYISESVAEVENAIAEGKAVLLQVNKEGNFANFAGKAGLDLFFVGFTGNASDNMHIYLYHLYCDGGCSRSNIWAWT